MLGTATAPARGQLRPPDQKGNRDEGPGHEGLSLGSRKAWSALSAAEGGTASGMGANRHYQLLSGYASAEAFLPKQCTRLVVQQRGETVTCHLFCRGKAWKPQSRAMWRSESTGEPPTSDYFPRTGVAPAVLTFLRETKVRKMTDLTPPGEGGAEGENGEVMAGRRVGLVRPEIVLSSVISSSVFPFGGSGWRRKGSLTMHARRGQMRQLPGPHAAHANACPKKKEARPNAKGGGRRPHHRAVGRMLQHTSHPLAHIWRSQRLEKSETRWRTPPRQKRPED